MTTAYQHRPLSSILGPNAAAGSKAPSGETPPADEDQLPEKYKGKSIKDVVEMHQNAERHIGTLRNELGTLRGVVTDLSRITRPQPATQAADEERLDVSGDELLADPVSTVRKVVKHDLDKARIESEERDMKAAAAREADKLVTEFGDIASIVGTDEFQEFVSRTSFRQRDMQTAANGSGMEQVAAARRLLEDFADYQKVAGEKSKPTNVDEARKVSTEGGGNSGKVSSKAVFHESDVLRVIQEDPGKWRSPSYQKEILAAIREGRYVKSS